MSGPAASTDVRLQLFPPFGGSVEVIPGPASCTPPLWALSSSHQPSSSPQMFLIISSLHSFPEHKQHLEQLTPNSPPILPIPKLLVTRATTAPFPFPCSERTKNQHVLLKVKKNNSLCSCGELLQNLSCNLHSTELRRHKQRLLPARAANTPGHGARWWSI